MLADNGIVHGNITLADIFFLIAAILFLVVSFTRRQDIPNTLLPLGLAALAFGWLVL